MRVKTFDFPSFEEWFNTNMNNLNSNDYGFKNNIGSYVADISPFCWYPDSVTYMAAIACSHNPHNIYAPSISKKYTFRYYRDKHSIDDLRKWYQEVCIKLNEDFANYIYETYLV